MKDKAYSLQKIFLFVMIFHMIALSISLFSFKKKRPLKKMVVHEKRLLKTVPQPQKKTPSIARKQPLKKHSPLPKIQKPHQAPKTRPQQTMFTDLEQSLDLLSKDSASFNPLPVPKMVHLKIEKTPASANQTFSYEQDLIQWLQTQLEFQTTGSVTMEITIKENGALLKSKTLFSKSKENENYLKNRLHKLNFPCFNAYGISETHLTFVVNFCND